MFVITVVITGAAVSCAVARTVVVHWIQVTCTTVIVATATKIISWIFVTWAAVKGLIAETVFVFSPVLILTAFSFSVTSTVFWIRGPSVAKTTANSTITIAIKVLCAVVVWATKVF